MTFSGVTRLLLSNVWVCKVEEVMLLGHKRTGKGVITPKFSIQDKKDYEYVNTIHKNNIMADILDSLKNLIGKKPNHVYREIKKMSNDPHLDQREILSYIDKHLSPTKALADKFGEVFTPMSFVNKMLDSLESVEPNIFKDKTKKWLDPASGMGNYPVAIFYRLMDKLEGVTNDKQKRADYIIKNMIYMVELQEENVNKCKGIFSKFSDPKKGGAEPNLLECNTLTEFLVKEGKDYNFQDGTTKFDIILGNPPYNPPKTDSRSSGNLIWQNFVMKSYSILDDNGYLLFVHPPGWKKPTDKVYKPQKFIEGDYTGQIRQGQVWQILKDTGVFKFIYTNDQRLKTIGDDYLPHFPAVDYYVYQKGGDKSGCNTKNIFLGKIDEYKGVRLNYNLKYLPNLITKQTQDILHKMTSKEGDKPEFGRFRNGKGFSVDSSKGKYKYIYTYNKKSEPKYQYSDIIGDNNINLDKVVMNFDGGIDCYTIQYIKKDDRIGSYEMTMYSKVESDKDGKRLEAFFKSDLVKFIFLITQYASGKMTKNEPLVANSITIPPEGTADYYKFFGIEEHKKYIEDILAHYEKFKAPKRDGTRKAKNSPVNETRKVEVAKKPAPKRKVSKKAAKPKQGGRRTRKIRHT